MALFKIAKGPASRLDNQSLKEGNCWFTTDERKMYIDISDSERVCLNAADADHSTHADAANLSLNGLFYIEGTAVGTRWKADLTVHNFSGLHEGILLAYRVPTNSVANQELIFSGTSSTQTNVIKAVHAKTNVALKANEILAGMVILLRYNGTAWDCLGNSSLGIPLGGDKGQVLTKNSTSDGDAVWKDPFTSVRGNASGNGTDNVPIPSNVRTILQTENGSALVYMNGVLLEQGIHYNFDNPKANLVLIGFESNTTDIFTFLASANGINHSFESDNYISKYGDVVNGSLTANAFIGPATSADRLTTPVTLTINGATKQFDGSGNISWTAEELNITSNNHTHNYVPLSGNSTISGTITANGFVGNVDGNATSATTATTATKLNCGAVGNASKPVYFNSEGKPVACTSISLKAATAGRADTATTADKVQEKLTLFGNEYDGSIAQTIDLADVGLAPAMIYQGVTTTPIENGTTTASIQINGESRTAQSGWVVLYDNQEFVFDGSSWEQLGVATSFALNNHEHGYIKNNGVLPGANGKVVITDNSGKITSSAINATALAYNVSATPVFTSGTSLGTISYNGTTKTVYAPNATTTQKGLLSVSSGNGLSVSNGVISMGAASGTAAGAITTGAQTIAGNKTMTGPLYINSTQEVGLDQNGALVIGTKAGVNIGIDTNEIQARNNNAISPLYLNPHGGNILAGGGMTVAGGWGQIDQTTTIANDAPAALYFRVKQTDNDITNDLCGIRVYDDHDAYGYGQNMVIYSNGNMVIGSGESPTQTYANVLKGNTDENMYITSDGSIYFYTNCNTWANRKTGVYINTAGALYGAVYNDYAEYRIGDTTEPGRCVVEVGDDTLTLSTERMQPGASIVSDTFGFAIGKTETAKTPIAVSGRVLAYPYEDLEEFKRNIGRPVCAAPNGCVSIMTDEEYQTKGYCAIGTISAVPTYETWGENNVPVDGRVWIKVI